MKPDLHHIHELIGEDNLDEVIKLLMQYLRGSRHDDLLDGLVLQKAEWSEYKRRNIAGIAKTEELNEVRNKILVIARELDRRPEKAEAPEKRPEPAPWPEPEKPRRREPPPPPPPPEPQYVARCFFTGDLAAYFVTPQGQIMMQNPLTNFTAQVAMQVPSMNAAFAWVFVLPNGIYYNIDHNGAIWGSNAFGMPMQVGYVQYF